MNCQKDSFQLTGFPNKFGIRYGYVFYKGVFSISKIAFESFLANCSKAMPTFMQLFSYLLNKLLHKVNCIKVGMAF